MKNPESTSTSQQTILDHIKDIKQVNKNKKISINAAECSYKMSTLQPKTKTRKLSCISVESIDTGSNNIQETSGKRSKYKRCIKPEVAKLTTLIKLYKLYINNLLQKDTCTRSRVINERDSDK